MTDKMLDYTFQWRVVWRSLPRLLEGAIVTIEIALASIAIGMAIALVLALFRLRGRGLSYRFATAWVELARNTPALFQIYMVFFGLGSFGVLLSPFVAVLIAISFNNAGYLCEILRGGFASVPGTQLAASRSLGMSSFQAHRHVVIPQVLRATFYPITNQIVWAVLTSSLGMVVGLKELAGMTQVEQSKSFRTFEFFIVAAAMYYLIAKAIMLTARLIGWRLLRER